MLSKKNNDNNKLLITGNPFSWNLGSMALVVSFIETILSMDEDIFFYKGSIDKGKDIERFSKFFSKDKFNKNIKIFGFNKGRLLIPLATQLLQLLSIPYYIRAKLILDNPGEATRDSWLIAQFIRFLLAKMFRKKFIILNISAGPFKYNFVKKLAKLMYSNCFKVYIREVASKEYLEKIGVTNIELVADHAFLLRLPSKKRRTYLKEKYLQNKLPFIGFVVRFNYGKYDNYKTTIIAFLKYVCNIENKNVILIPHGDEDRSLSLDICGKVKSNRLTIINGSLLPCELKYLISKAEINISSRIHACIAGWSTNTPTITYVKKNDHRCLGMSKMINLEEYIIDPEEATEKSLIDCYLKLSNNRNKVQDNIQKDLEEIKCLSKKSPEFIISVLNNI